MIYCIIRIQQRVGAKSICNVAVTPILNLCNQLELHFYSGTVAVIQCHTDNKSSPQPAAAESRWSPLSPLISTPQPATAGLMRQDKRREEKRRQEKKKVI